MAFPTETKKEVWLALRADGALGSGSAADPYDASSPTLLDDRMNSFPGNTTIHLGPGIFQTRGWSPNIGGWLPLPGQKIMGAGIDATILKLVGVTDIAATTSAIGGFFTHFLPNFEAADFTIDCNLAGQPIPEGQSYAAVSCAAIQVGGRHVRLRRLRAINFGSQAKVPVDGYIECFVMSPAFAYPTYPETFDCVMENCIIEKPSRTNLYITTCLALACAETPNDGVMAYHRDSGIRNCLVNFEYLDDPVGISGITFSGTTATVTTKSPHNRLPGQSVVISGALENGVPSGSYSGGFPITAVVSPTQFQCALFTTPVAEPTGEMYIGKYPSHGNPITAMSPLTGSPIYRDRYDVQTPQPAHGRKRGDHERFCGRSRVRQRLQWLIPDYADSFFDNAQLPDSDKSRDS
jgi:hypothetical protein